MEREEFYRLKKIQEKKKKIKDANEKIRKALKDQGVDLEAKNILEDDKDEDLLF